MLWYILIGVAVALGLFLCFVATRPSDFKVVRSAIMSAPQAVVFDQVNDFHKWEEWSPWAKLDPTAKNTFEGAASGKGAGFSWSGNSKVGAGRMTITESRPSEFIRLNLEFLKPFKATNTTEFTFKPVGSGQTEMTWNMTGCNSYVSKLFCLFMNMDKMVGTDFEKGLAGIKAVAERVHKGK